MKRIAILGSTGSIGRSTLSVVESNPGRFQVVTMAAGSNVEAALEQTLRWKPKVLSLALEQDADVIRKELKAEGLAQIEVVHGQAGSVRVATHPEVGFVVSAIVGVAGLKATYEAVCAGKEIGLANKECLVAAGELITREARKQVGQVKIVERELRTAECLLPIRRRPKILSRRIAAELVVRRALFRILERFVSLAHLLEFLFGRSFL